jgi:hypothetical protein
MHFNIKNLSDSKNIRTILISIGVLVILLVVFATGIKIGEHRARFAGEFGDNFERNFIGPRGGMMGEPRMMPNTHGAVGQILSIKLPEFVVSGPDNLEKTVLVATSTLVRQFQQNITGADLKTGDDVIIIGNPNANGQIEAKLIRVLPQK